MNEKQELIRSLLSQEKDKINTAKAVLKKQQEELEREEKNAELLAEILNKV